MRRGTHVHYKKHIPEHGYPCFTQEDRTDRTYTSHDIAASLQKRIETMLADPNVTDLSIQISLHETCHEMTIVDADTKEGN
jgi:hypothetical protein